MTTGQKAVVRDEALRDDDRRMPRHVAIIMDGNGRWAAARGLDRTFGHKKGVEALRTTVSHADKLGIEFLTLFSFSSENWSRPQTEVRQLMGLLRLFIRRDLADLHKANVRVRIIGARDDLAGDIRSLLDEAEELTRGNTGLNLVVAFNYGARNEIERAVRRLAEDVEAGRLKAADIDSAAIGSRLDTADIPDPELIIRTSGEQRLSNFLLWQAAYSEFVFLPVLWPDFSPEDLERAIDDYLGRDRRFGGLTTKGRAVP
ncbi:MAG TPA: isoprenyl transferase [Kaistiaceae bacterium]|nr:isoprenyl transferase [Kaistiaceae bacterium]